MSFYVDYEKKVNWDFNVEEQLRVVAEETLDYEKCPFEVSLNLLITDNDEIRKVNKEQRSIDSATDVLSFPMIDFKKPSDFADNSIITQDCFDPDSGELVLGDIVLSADKVEEQAIAFGHTILREFSFLIAHSMLHLLGYDHLSSEEEVVMESKQKDILSALHIER
jgi:probable rRNA maturation factor